MKERMDCHLALKVTHILFYGGFVLMLLGLCVGAGVNSDVLLAVFGITGAVGIVGGLIFGYLYVRCPACGTSLMLGGRVPTHLPKHCPECGAAICPDQE